MMVMREEDKKELFRILKTLTWCILLIALSLAVFYRIGEYYILRLI